MAAMPEPVSPMQHAIAPDRIEQAAAEFRAHAPCGYASVGDLFDPSLLAVLADEVQAHLDRYPAEPDIHGSSRKHRLSDLAAMPETVRGFITWLNSPGFRRVLSKITGIADLEADPELRGGGIHAIGRGGYLKLHTDFNWHRGLAMHRRLNLLVYLNRDWKREWKGDIELWNPDASERVFSLEPKLGNALLFETNDISYHGHPDPLQCPEGVFRTSIALYYYTRTRPETGLVFGRTEMTNFVERPGERFERDRLRHWRQRIQLRAKRWAHALVPRRNK